MDIKGGPNAPHGAPKQAKEERIRNQGVPARRFRGPRRKKNAPPDRTVLQMDGFWDPQIDILKYFMLIIV